MTDSDAMKLALAQARLGIGKTAPNPPVGAVIVKNGEVLGAGWHRRAGAPHAEREAIADAKNRFGAAALIGATIYVTLEPCSTHGRTPPCTDGLIDAGFSRVVYAVKDANPAHAGRANRVLEAAGIDVLHGVEEQAARDIVRPFFHVQETGLPWLVWKVAVSLDGQIARPSGESPWLSDEAALADVQQLRSEVDAILTSGETLRCDDPRLTIRRPEFALGREQPWRVVVTKDAQSLPRTAAIFHDEWAARSLVFEGKTPEDLREILRSLVQNHGVLSVMLECGGVLAREFFAADLIREVVTYVTPHWCGQTKPSLAGHLPASITLRETSVTVIGRQARFRGLV